jgi:hypothetical protein
MPPLAGWAESRLRKDRKDCAGENNQDAATPLLPASRCTRRLLATELHEEADERAHQAKQKTSGNRQTGSSLIQHETPRASQARKQASETSLRFSTLRGAQRRCPTGRRSVAAWRNPPLPAV